MRYNTLGKIYEMLLLARVRLARALPAPCSLLYLIFMKNAISSPKLS